MFYYPSFGSNIECSLVDWLWRGGPFSSIFPFCT